MRGLLPIQVRRLISKHRIAGGLVAAASLVFSDCKRPATQARREQTEKKPAESPGASQPKSEGNNRSIEGEVHAVWYEVPVDSLARRRAGKDELTAAHNHFPLGTLVRVTHVANGKSVIVRITDRGITKRRATIDLCKEAAEKLDMLREGSALVRLEVVAEEASANATPKAETTPASQP